MKRSLAVLALVALVSCSSAPPAPAVSPEMAAWQQRADGITIVRDDWGVPHVTGKTDADAVFGLMYAQAEDDFNRVETNFINAMGRLAEAEGEQEIYRDLRMKLFIDPVELKAEFEKAPDSLKQLMTAWADGLNFYLATPSRGDAARHHDVRTVDGAQLQRRQHRRRHRERVDPAPRSVLRQESGGAVARPARPALHDRAARADRLQRLGDRAGQHHRRQGAAVDQPAHLVLVPRGSADDEPARA